MRQKTCQRRYPLPSGGAPRQRKVLRVERAARHDGDGEQPPRLHESSDGARAWDCEDDDCYCGNFDCDGESRDELSQRLQCADPPLPHEIGGHDVPQDDVPVVSPPLRLRDENDTGQAALPPPQYGDAQL